MSRYQKRRYSETDIDQVIARAEESIVRNTDFRASWLLEGEIGSHHWKTANGNKHRKANGRWENTINVNFNVKLPDDTLLTDQKNSVMLIALQKWMFYFRSGLYGMSPGPTQWADYTRTIINITRWMYLDKDHFAPERFGFALLDKDAIKSLIKMITKGGWSHAYLVVPRLLDKLHMMTFGISAPSELHECPFNLPMAIRRQIQEALVADDTFHSHCKKMRKQGVRGFPLSYVRHLIGSSCIGCQKQRLKLFLAQFKTDLESKRTHPPCSIATQHPRRSSPAPGAEAAAPARRSYITNIIYHLNPFLRGHAQSDTTIPYIDLKTVELIAGITDDAPDKKHRDFIPLRFGLKILRKSTEMVEVYGEAIVNAVIDYVSTNEKLSFNISAESSTQERESQRKQDLMEIVGRHQTREFEGLPSRPIGEALNITQWRKPLRDLDVNNPSLNQAMAMLIGAQANIISILKPMRHEELSSIKRNCIFTDTLLGGAWLDTTVGKTGAEGINMNIARPIPNLAAHAILQLKKLGEKLSIIYNDNTDHGLLDLFYFPTTGTFSKPSRKTTPVRLKKCQDQFSDYIEAPIDELGRRFYPSAHEFRKFFILLMYWHEPHIGFSCAAWMASHINVNHTRDYTDASISVNEISLWEAECIEDKIIDLENIETQSHHKDYNQTAGLVALYNAVKRRFGVGRIQGLRRKDYLEFIQDLRHAGQLDLRPFVIYTAQDGNEPVGIDLAFKFEDKKDEQFEP